MNCTATRKAMSVLVSFCLLCGLLAVWPAVRVYAATATHDIGREGGLTINGTNAGTHYTVSGSSTTNTIYVNAPGKEVTLTLTGVSIKSGVNIIPLDLQAGTLHLILKDGTENTLESGGGSAAALRVAEDATLYIEGTGKLTATANGRGAAIGGAGGSIATEPGKAGGIINITNCTVVATSKGTGAAIGGGGSSMSGGAGGTINITGGTVTATSESIGAAIGGGGGSSSLGGASGTIHIKNGTVEANCTGLGAAIGGGSGGSRTAGAGETITIEGGTVTATTTGTGAAIGGGGGRYGATGGDIVITGASTQVTASSLSSSSNGTVLGGTLGLRQGSLLLSGGATLTLTKASPDAASLSLSPDGLQVNGGTLYTGLQGESPVLVTTGTVPKAALALTGGSATASALFDIDPTFGTAPAAASLAHGASLNIPLGATQMTLTLSPAAPYVLATASATGATASHAGNVVTVTPSAGAYLTSNVALTVTLRDGTPDPGNSETPGNPGTPGSPEAPGTEQEAIPASGLSLNMGAKLLKKGQKVALKATVSPANTADKTVVWASSNKKVATVTSSGLVKALKNGKATITAKAGGKTVKCQIIVRADAPQRAVKAVKLDKRATTLKLGKTLALKATLRPERPFNKKLVWASSDPSIATVNAKGVVKAKAKGRVKITATSFEGGKVATCTVTVQ